MGYCTSCLLVRCIGPTFHVIFLQISADNTSGLIPLSNTVNSKVTGSHVYAASPQMFFYIQVGQVRKCVRLLTTAVMGLITVGGM